MENCPGIGFNHSNVFSTADNRSHGQLPAHRTPKPKHIVQKHECDVDEGRTFGSPILDSTIVRLAIQRPIDYPDTLDIKFNSVIVNRTS